MASSTSATLGAKASTMGWIWAGWMLNTPARVIVANHVFGCDGNQRLLRGREAELAAGLLVHDMNVILLAIAELAQQESGYIVLKLVAHGSSSAGSSAPSTTVREWLIG